MGRDEKKMAEHIFSGACFQGLRPAVEKELSDSEKWPGLFEQLFPKDKWSHSWVDVLGKAR
jgi:hypothetical protein